mgnify:CR=1 FL=1
MGIDLVGQSLTTAALVFRLKALNLQLPTMPFHIERHDMPEKETEHENHQKLYINRITCTINFRYIKKLTNQGKKQVRTGHDREITPKPFPEREIFKSSQVELQQYPNDTNEEQQPEQVRPIDIHVFRLIIKSHLPWDTNQV